MKIVGFVLIIFLVSCVNHKEPVNQVVNNDQPICFPNLSDAPKPLHYVSMIQFSDSLFMDSFQHKTPVIFKEDTLKLYQTFQYFEIPEICKEFLDGGGMRYFFSAQLNGIGKLEKFKLIRGGICDVNMQNAIENLFMQLSFLDRALWGRTYIIMLQIKSD